MGSTDRGAEGGVEGGEAGGGRLAGRRVLVTGASSGIGAATAVALVDAGARVGLLARREHLLRDLADGLAGGRTRHAVGAADVRDEEAAVATVDEIAAALGGLDGVVNAAGIARPSRLLDAARDDWRATFEVNVLGLLATASAAVPHLLAAASDGPADLVNISSISGRRRPNAEMTVYAASKFAVHALSDGYREELAPHGVRTTVIAPGYVATPIFRTAEHDTVVSRDFDERSRARGMPAERVAAAVVQALATPAGTMQHEIALLSLDQ